MHTYFELDGELFLRTKPLVNDDDTLDYNPCKTVYELVTKNGYLELKYLDSDNIEVYKEVEIEELKNQYISISEFFKEANYIGQRVIRTHYNKHNQQERDTSITGDRKFLLAEDNYETDINSIANTYVMLYKSESHIIIYEKSFYDDKRYDDIIVLDQRYVDDNWYYGAYEMDIKLEPTAITSYLYNNKVSNQHQKRY